MSNYLYIPDNSFLPAAKELAAFTTQLSIITQPSAAPAIYLRLDHGGLAIIGQGFNALYISEMYAKVSMRLDNLGSELLIQAIKLKKAVENNIVVWDLTAGLGKDALLIASFGYFVIMVEQDPLLATILNYALQNGHLPASNLKVVYANSIDFTASTEEAPDIIYLDPMFKDNKSAKAKKDMQIIQYLAHAQSDEQVQALFWGAYAKVKSKLIVKRDNKQASLVILPKPSFTKLGKTVRYDIYTPNSR